MSKVNNKNTRTTSLSFTPFSRVSNFVFEQVKALKRTTELKFETFW